MSLRSSSNKSSSWTYSHSVSGKTISEARQIAAAERRSRTFGSLNKLVSHAISDPRGNFGKVVRVTFELIGNLGPES